MNAHSFRIRFILFGRTYFKDGSSIEDKLFGLTESFPNLTTLVRHDYFPVRHEYFHLNVAIQKAPLLRVVRGYQVCYVILEDTPRTWQVIDTYDQLDDILPFLVQQSSLREVRFFGDTWLSDTSSTPSQDYEANFTPLDLTTLHLPSKRLSFFSIPSTLSDFYLYGVFSTICSAIPFLSQMPQLKVLSIAVEVGGPSNSELTLAPCSASVVEIRTGDLYKSENDSFHTLLEIFPAITPLVRRLILTFDNYPENFNLPHNHGLHHLEVLHLICAHNPSKSNISPEEPIYVPPSVIKVGTTAIGNFFNRLVPASVEELEIEPYYGGSYSLNNFPHVSRWITLRSLTLLGYIGSFQDLHLPNLVTLSLQRVSRRDVTKFCQQLAIYRLFPSLTHIILPVLPDWDIFFIMLEHRNLARTQGMAPITRVELPAICPPSIRRLLVDLVQGRQVPRPSNFALSFAGHVEQLCDPLLWGYFTTIS